MNNIICPELVAIFVAEEIEDEGKKSEALAVGVFDGYDGGTMEDHRKKSLISELFDTSLRGAIATDAIKEKSSRQSKKGKIFFLIDDSF